MAGEQVADVAQAHVLVHLCITATSHIEIKLVVGFIQNIDLQRSTRLPTVYKQCLNWFTRFCLCSLFRRRVSVFTVIRKSCSQFEVSSAAIDVKRSKVKSRQMPLFQKGSEVFGKVNIQERLSSWSKGHRGSWEVWNSTVKCRRIADAFGILWILPDLDQRFCEKV